MSLWRTNVLEYCIYNHDYHILYKLYSVKKPSLGYLSLEVFFLLVQ